MKMASRSTAALLLLLALSASPLSSASSSLSSSASSSLTGSASAAANAANPIRKVVTMLQDMQKKITEESKKEQELFDKFMCYCKTSRKDLSESVQAAVEKIACLEGDLKSGAEKKEQTESSLKNNQGSREAAKEDVTKATVLREKEAAEYAKIKADLEANIAAIKKAIAALETGLAGGFLQTPEAGRVRSYALEKADIPDSSRQELLAFLSGSQGSDYAPQSGEIVGILKQMLDEMMKDLAQATDAEKAAVQNYEELMEAKKKELSTLQAQIESEMTRIGDLGVSLAAMSNDLEDTKEALGEDNIFQAELNKGCDTKEKEWEAVKKSRADELLALAETIRVLNDDDALELFKKTLPGASASLMQVKVSASSQKNRALELIRAAAKAAKRPELDLIALALSGKMDGFKDIVRMIDDMVGNLKKEQFGDDSKKEYCEGQFDHTDDKKKALENAISDSEKAIGEMEGSLETLKEEIEAFETGIKKLDKAVVEATEQRKEENADYKELMTNNGLAKEVLGWAKNRMNKYYDPAMYKPPPKRELSAGDRAYVSNGGVITTPMPGGIANTGIGASLVQISAHNHREAPAPPPETFKAYAKKGQESGGVIAMIDLLIKDLDAEMQQAKTMEMDSQADYEKMTEVAGDKRAADAKSLTQKNSEKADTEEALEAAKTKKAGAERGHMAVLQYIASLHKECDWLLQYYEARKSARVGETQSLINAKAILNGADYALLQTASAGRTSLRGQTRQ